jgi:ATP-dependent DNA helicase RecQ
VSTIQAHLTSFIAKGEVDINKIVPGEKQLLIKEAIKIYGRQSFKTLKDDLPEDVSYGEIKMVIAAQEREERA